MGTTEPTIIDWITAIGAVATPVLLAIFTAIGWTIQRRVETSQKAEEELRERSRKLEEELRDDRLKVYNEILEPFIILLTKDEGIANERSFKGKNKQDIAVEKILSLAYRQTAFKLSLFASDNVVKAYNNLMQFFYSRSAAQVQEQKQDSRELGISMLELFGAFLLEIRKSVGNEETSLDSLAMLEWLISDIRQLRERYGVAKN